MLGLIIGAIGGFFSPRLVETAARPLAGAVSKWVAVEEGEMSLLAYMIAMVLAMIVANLLSVDAFFMVMVGGVLGFFGLRIKDAIMKASSKNETESDTAE